MSIYKSTLCNTAAVALILFSVFQLGFLSTMVKAQSLDGLQGAIPDSPSTQIPAGTRCAREGADGRVIEGPCGGYSLDGHTQYPFKANTCYLITGLNNASPPFWKIEEQSSCANFDALLQPPTSIPPSGTDLPGSGSTKLDSYLNTIVNLLSGLVGLVIVLSIIIAGIQYMTARDNASQVSAAKNRILMAVLAFFVFVMGYALLQWLIPGGVFK